MLQLNFSNKFRSSKMYDLVENVEHELGKIYLYVWEKKKKIAPAGISLKT